MRAGNRILRFDRRSRGPHLHFEMRYCDQTFDPEFIVDFQTGQLKYQTFALEKQFFNIHSRASEILEEDDDDFPLLASAEGDTASGDILERIAAAQKKEEQQTKTADRQFQQRRLPYDQTGRYSRSAGA